MSTVESTEASVEEQEAADGGAGAQGDVVEEHAEGHGHPSEGKYVVVALILAVLTGLEFTTYFLEDDLGRGGIIAALMPLMIAKFWLVAAFFMHLKFDHPLFTRMFVAGIAFAVGVYIVMMAMFEFWV